MKKSRSNEATALSVGSNDIAKIKKTMELCEGTMRRATSSAWAPRTIRTGKKAYIRFHHRYVSDAGESYWIAADIIGYISDMYIGGSERKPYISITDGHMVAWLSFADTRLTGEEDFESTSLPMDGVSSVTYIGG